jgi:hypothetical protein
MAITSLLRLAKAHIHIGERVHRCIGRNLPCERNTCSLSRSASQTLGCPRHVHPIMRGSMRSPFLIKSNALTYSYFWRRIDSPFHQ